MSLDPVKNFAYANIVTAPSPAASGTSFTVTSGYGAKFPDPATDGEYNVTVWATNAQPTTANAEIVRVTARSSDTFTITRAQEGTTNRTIIVGDQIALTVTKKLRDDINTHIEAADAHIEAADAHISATTGHGATGAVVGTTNIQTLTNKTYDTPIIKSFDGWMLVTDTWTRTGNYTFKVSGDVTTIYKRGVKLRYKDGGTYEYGIIGSSSYSAPDTTVTLITNSDYAMAATTITDTYIALTENPLNFPLYFNFATTVSVSGGTAPTYSTSTVRFWFTGINMNTFIELVNTSGGTAGSGTSEIRLTIPLAPALSTSNIFLGVGASYEAGGTYGGVFARYGGSTDIYFHLYNFSNITGNDQSSADRYIKLQLNYL